MRKFIIIGGLLAALPFSPCDAGTTEETDTAFPEAGKSYTLHMSQQSGTCIQEEADGTLTVGSYDPSVRCFWEFIPTGQEHRYYIRNLTTGNYIQSTNKATGSASIMKTGTDAVEFYVGQNTEAGTATSGYWYMSSTDNTVFDKVGSSTKGLNKDGSSSNVIVYACGSGNKNSFWNITVTDYAYEVHPFRASASVGKADYKYEINASTGKNVGLDAEGNIGLQEKSADKGQSWYFVGESNTAGGYLIVSTARHQAIDANQTLTAETETAQRWNIFEISKNGETHYVFRPHSAGNTNGGALTVDGDSLFNFKAQRTDFQLSHQIYNQPCGTLGTAYVKALSLTGDAVLEPISYPLGTLNSSNTVIQHLASKPTSWYTLFTKDKATLARGKAFTVNVTLSATPAEGSELFAYFDWDGDGVFEASSQLAGEQKEYAATVDVPADARLKSSRMRLRLTDNGLKDAEDEVNGQTLDVIVKASDATDAYAIRVETSSEERGSVAISPEEESYTAGATVTATATPKGNAKFVCWREGKDVVSIKAEYAFTADHAATLTAYFSPNTKKETVGIDDALSESNVLVKIEADNKELNVVTDAAIRAVHVYNANGALLAQSTSKRVSLKHLPTGSYIVKVQTEGKNTSAKVHIK